MLNWHSYCIDCAIAEFLLRSTATAAAVVFGFSARIDSQFWFRFIDLEKDLHMCEWVFL